MKNQSPVGLRAYLALALFSATSVSTAAIGRGSTAAAASSATGGGACSSAADCSGAGACEAGRCACERGWAGATCAALDNSTRVPVGGGFRMDSFHVWGAQVVRGDDALWHMLASVYPAQLPFYSSWLYCAQIAHATATRLLGPYAFVSLALPYGAEDAWDRSVMNPKILRAPASGGGGGESPWLLYYVGSSYPGPTPNGGSVPLPSNQSGAQASQRIGLATAPAPGGPWLRRGPPVLETRPGEWDARIVSNPAVTPFGGNSTRLLMVYKASSPAGGGTAQTRVCMGVAVAESWDAPFVRPRPDPIFPCPENSFFAEDPSLHRDAQTGFFHLVFKDFNGHFTHAGYSGAHAISADGVTWNVTAPALAYTTTHVWSDGVLRTQNQQERAQVLLDAGGAPLATFFATNMALNGSSLFWNFAMPNQAVALDM